MNNPRHPHKRKVRKRRRNSVLKGLLVVMLALLLVVSVAASVFVINLFMGDFIDDVLPIPAFAIGENNTAVTVTAMDNDSDTPPGLIGELPEVDIGSSSVPPELEQFAAFSFFLPEMAEYYQQFQSENPELSAETVVWKVNALLHVPFYSYIRVNNDPNPLLVNPSHRLPAGFVPAVLVPVYDGNPDLLATPATAEAFRRMRESAIAAGLDIAVVSAYRTAERQRVLFDRQSGDGVVARPYHSEHQTGRALDLWGPGPSGLLDSGGGPPSPTGLWVAENAHNYGFIIRYTPYNTHITGFISEPWHITYVTYEIAQNIHQNRLSSLEEFVARNPNVRMQ